MAMQPTNACRCFARCHDDVLNLAIRTFCVPVAGYSVVGMANYPHAKYQSVVGKDEQDTETEIGDGDVEKSALVRPSKVASDRIEESPGSCLSFQICSLKMLVLGLVVLQNTAYALVRRYSRGALHESYSTSSVLLVMEVSKLLLSAVQGNLPVDRCWTKPFWTLPGCCEHLLFLSLSLSRLRLANNTKRHLSWSARGRSSCRKSRPMCPTAARSQSTSSWSALRSASRTVSLARAPRVRMQCRALGGDSAVCNWSTDARVALKMAQTRDHSEALQA
eukprot:4843895-Pleurochrysis_carterae.AAC.1